MLFMHLTDLFLFVQKIRPVSTVTPQMNPKPKNTDTILRKGATSNKSRYVAFKV